MKNLKYEQNEHQSIFPLWGGGSNLILGTGKKNQTIIFNTCVIFEKIKIRMEKLLSEKIFVRKKLVGKTIFVRKILLGKQFVGKIFVKKENCWENNFCKKKIYWKKFLSEKKLLEIFFIRKWWV